MQYRKLGNTGIEISALGMGTVRLPIVGDNVEQIDTEKAISVIRRAIDRGVNYIDTAFNYHGGNAETVIKKALEGEYRQKVYVGDKMPLWLCGDTYEQCEYFFHKQLRKVDCGYFDLYFLHSLNKNSWEKAKKIGVLKLLERLKEMGKIKHIGFSFHDKYETFEEIVNSYPWEFCLLQLNYMDMNCQAGERGMKLAAEKGMGVLAMEPLKGGQLVKKPPKSVQEIWDKSHMMTTLAERGLSFLLNMPEISCVLSGMNELHQVDENVDTAEKYLPESLDWHELSIYKEVKKELRRKIKIPCTGCNYCMPCPKGVDIPANMDCYNIGHMYGSIDETKKFFNRSMFDNRRSTLCVNCGRCIEMCPQGLNIPMILRRISKEWAF